jgi:lipoprotein-anchoring transpeptidase ErfK/SrfK
MTTRFIPRFLLAVWAVAFAAAVLAAPASAERRTAQDSAGEQASIEILEAEQLLSDLGYWPGPVDGMWDAATRHAVIALQKTAGLPRTGVLTATELEALRGGARPAPREVGYSHVEVDLTKQILFFVDASGAISHVLPVSSGTDRIYVEKGIVGRAFTPRGRFVVERKIAGWRRSPLGLLYYPSYFHEGWAIHGSPSVPATPASHGCVRIPMFAAIEFSALAPVGTVVLVYD